ncbi:transmembrane amino acid transporter [Xylaria bambusicola]|uniref:transmembrane amino acid transporter n=1 Tax=Xylaria bambusicola TaxID=326684 RepID=UPI00200859D9|nr:transmembrane amino acid transporter [Xylaria bambusicola]KAI0517596.1 transmembrane amino acid transporter [Xylaria bambusicola]
MSNNTYHPGHTVDEKSNGRELSGSSQDAHGFHDEAAIGMGSPGDVFGSEDGHDIKYKTLSWPLVAVLMITEIVSNGMLSLPSSLAAVGVVPGVIVIVFLGVFATYTSWVLIQFKLRHPEVHNMGDAGMIIFGPVGREILSAGTIIFAVFATGSQILAGQLALSVLSDQKLCTVAFAGIFAVAVTLASIPRTLDSLGFLSIVGGVSIIVAGIVALAGAGAMPIRPGDIQIAVASDFTSAFISITNPVFAYAGHFMFFILISEMKRPQDAMKAAYVLQIVATSLYVVFAVVSYWYIGSGISSPSLLSLSPLFSKISFGLAIPNFFIAGSLYSHTASKLVFVRLFRHTQHIHSHTYLGWGVWTVLILLANGAAFVFAVGIPTFNYLVGISAALFASWYTYGLAGAFWLHDTFYFEGGFRGWYRKPVMLAVNVFTLLAGAFICVGGLYATIVALIRASKEGELPSPFQC